MSRGGRKRGDQLSDDDAALWTSISRGFQPLKAKPRVAAGNAADQPPPVRALREGDCPTPPVNSKSKTPSKTPAKLPTKSAPVIDVKSRPAAAPGPVIIERRKARRIASGRTEIDARIDLHGQRQSEAHHRLVAFLLRAQFEGYKTVLVITGKGRTRDDDEMGRRETGVLRQNVPRWLDGPELRPLVVGYSVAHARHGGEGALYVEIRRRRPG